MVRINNLALIALSASTLAVTIHHDRRGVILAEPDVLSRAEPLMDLDKRQNKAPDSPAVQKLKAERKAISPELDQATQDVQAARKAANAAIPQNLKQKEKDAVTKLKAIRQGLPEDKKKQLKENGKALEAARRKKSPAPSGPVASPKPSATPKS
ncbi:hypothetical protein VFPPC_11587 [Pochonia chlamydosporia 170]|uniref:Uncharacterized protein n=1 Tax=Pochonia chlamydosporia 170 TaxID=1380566 RepID=A0A179FPQ9_METCM|nr:hypothetical protein VFPPC_11587 [Pochonia chlamydosporia 170]OAQ67574.1 hypothetical protein VFPPC_11587 [Pochonia chlamydosporia 170]